MDQAIWLTRKTLFRTWFVESMLQMAPIPGHKDCFIWSFCAGVVRKQGDWPLGGEIAEAMLERAPDYAGSHYAAALVAHHEGDHETVGAGVFGGREAVARGGPRICLSLLEIHRALTVGASPK